MLAGGLLLRRREDAHRPVDADASLDALTGRRLGGALFVLGGLVVAAIVLWPSGGDDDARGQAPAKIQPVRIVSVPQLGLAFAHPRTWTRSVSRPRHPPAQPRRLGAC